MSNANEPDQINAGALAMMIALVTLATLGIALYVTSIVRTETRDVESLRAESQDYGIRQLRAEQLSALAASPQWVDQAKGTVSIPIEAAMANVLAAVRNDPSALSP